MLDCRTAGFVLFWLSKKVNNENQFKASEIKKLCELLNIASLKERENIFFAPDVDKMTTIIKKEEA